MEIGENVHYAFWEILWKRATPRQQWFTFL